MLKNFLKNRKAQNTAEYALLIALVVAGVIAMQTYAQRALQARIHDASQYMATDGGDPTATLGNSTQYEPYYLKSGYGMQTQSTEDKFLNNNPIGGAGQTASSNRSRNGSQNATYDIASDQHTTD